MYLTSYPLLVLLLALVSEVFFLPFYDHSHRDLILIKPKLVGVSVLGVRVKPGEYIIIKYFYSVDQTWIVSL